MVVFVVGTFIICLKQIGLGQTIVTIALCVLLVLYAVMVCRVPRFRLREDQAGDNCYYLGFLFTLTSLALSLVAFTKAGTAEEGTKRVVEDFGIALASTIVGLALRVWFNQRRRDPVEEVETKTHFNVTDAAERLRTVLLQSVSKINQFQIAIRQSIEESNTAADNLLKKTLSRYEQANTEADKFLKKTLSRYEQAITEADQLLEKTLSHYDVITSKSAERFGQTLVTFGESAQQLNAAGKKSVSAVEGMVALIEAIKVPEDLIEKKFTSIATVVSETVTEFRQEVVAGSKEFQQLHRTLAGASAATVQLKEGIATITGVIERLKPLENTLDRTEGRLEALATGFEDAGKGFAAGGTLWREVLAREAADMKTAFEAASRVVAGASEEFHRSIVEPARNAGAALTAIAQQGDSLREIETQLRQLTVAFEKQIAALPKQRDRSRWPTITRFFNPRSPH